MNRDMWVNAWSLDNYACGVFWRSLVALPSWTLYSMYANASLRHVQDPSIERLDTA